MEKLDFKVLSSDLEIDLFIDRFKNYVGIKLPPDYVAQSRVVGAFLHNRLVGGYMLVQGPNFRSLLFVPDNIKKTDKFFRNDLSGMLEINGLWISSSLKSPKLQLSVWFNLVGEIYKSRKRFILLMRDMRNKTMARLLGMANPRTLYEGPPVLMFGDSTHNTIQVSVATRWSIVLNSYKYWMELRRRQQRADKFKAQVPTEQNSGQGTISPVELVESQ